MAGQTPHLSGRHVTEPPVEPRRAHFRAHIVRACAQSHAEVRWHSDAWIAEVTGADRRFLIIGQTFPLNNAASAHVATDKVATFDLLARQP